MNAKFKKKLRDFLVITAFFVAGGATLVGVGIYGDYARHDRAAHHQN